MLKNYLKIAFRNILRQKGYAAINMAGLSIGICCSLLILLWVQHEVSYDQFHTDKDHIHRVWANLHLSEDKVVTWDVQLPLANYLDENYPEIEETAYLSGREEFLFQENDHTFNEKGVFVSYNFFDFFDFPILQGDPKTLKDNPFSMFISEKLAVKYFGENWQNEEIIGRIFKMDNKKDMMLAGVFEDIPSQSSLQFDFVSGINTYLVINPWMDQWGNYMMRMFVSLHPDTDLGKLKEKIADAVVVGGNKEGTEVILQPLNEMYLYSNFEHGQAVGGRIEYVRIFLIAALFILLIACINFMNLATARSSNRAKEVGIRKVVGAERKNLIGQFLGESLVFTFFAVLMAFALAELLLPIFNDLTGKDMFIDYQSPTFWGLLIGIGITTAVLAGSYPAFFLSSFGIVEVLKGNSNHNTGSGDTFRKSLIVFQFSLSLLLIISALVIRNQIHFIQNKHLGLDKENVLSVEMGDELREKFPQLKHELLQQSGVLQVASSNSSPISVGRSTGDPTWAGKTPEQHAIFQVLDVSHDFINTMNIAIKEGRDFDEKLVTDTLNFLVNEVTAELMGTDSPIGKALEFWGQKGNIIGVVKDFHINSLHTSIKPLIIRLQPKNAHIVWVKTGKGKALEATVNVEKVYAQFESVYPFDYQWLDDAHQKRYKSESIIGVLANYFALLAILISCLGLFGLAAFTAEKRTKEIGVRKVLGASVGDILILLNKEFGRLIVIAFFLAIPFAYYFMNSWLLQFEYHTHLSVTTFALAGASIVLIALLTVSYQSMRAALKNPVKALRYE